MTSKVTKFFLLVTIIMVFFIAQDVNAQGTIRVNVDYIDNGLFPFVEIYTSVTNLQGLPLKNLSVSDFSVFEDDRPVTSFEIAPIQNVKQPLAIVLLIDTSGSMAEGPLQDSVAAAKTFIDTLSQQDQVAVLGFAGTPYTVLEFTDDKGQVKASLDSLVAGGDTALYDGIAQAVELLKNRTERRIIVLITDGTDSSIGNFDFKMALDEASSWAVPVYPIGFGNVDQKELEQMAQLTGGVAQIQPGSSDLQSAFNLVLQILREQYLIRYTSIFLADGTNHDIKVIVDGQSATRTFVALPGQIELTLPFQDGQTVGGNVLLRPIVDSPAPLAEMNILIDGEILQTVSTEPFEYMWDSTSVEPGEHQFSFSVKDIVGNSAQQSIALNIQPPITVSIVSPVDGEDLGAPTLVSADVKAMAGVAKVEFIVNNIVVQTLTAPPYETTIDWEKYPKGFYQLQVKATDVNGFSDTNEIVIQAEGSNIWLLVLIAGISFAALVIPIGLRIRKKSSGATAKPGEAILRMIAGTSPDRTWLVGKQEIGIGRNRNNYVQLRSSKASREHAVIRYENGVHILYNRKQDNPPLVNQEPVTHKRELKSGDIIKFGEDTIRYEQH